MKLFGIPLFKSKVKELRALMSQLNSKIEQLENLKEENKRAIENIRKEENDIKETNNGIIRNIEQEKRDLNKQRNSINQLREEQSEGNPYLANYNTPQNLDSRLRCKKHLNLHNYEQKKAS